MFSGGYRNGTSAQNGLNKLSNRYILENADCNCNSNSILVMMMVIFMIIVVQSQFFELPPDRNNSSKNRGFEKSRYSDKRVYELKNTKRTCCNFLSKNSQYTNAIIWA